MVSALFAASKSSDGTHFSYHPIAPLFQLLTWRLCSVFHCRAVSDMSQFSRNDSPAYLHKADVIKVLLRYSRRDVRLAYSKFVVTSCVYDPPSKDLSTRNCKVSERLVGMAVRLSEINSAACILQSRTVRSALISQCR
jgi:hypothetical protein